MTQRSDDKTGFIAGRLRNIGIIQASGIIASLLAIIGLLGWVFGMRLLSSLRASFIPMAPETAVLLLFAATILHFTDGGKSAIRHRTLLAAGAVIVTSDGLLTFLEHVFNTALTITEAVAGPPEMLGPYPIGRMSPATGMLFVLSGIALLLLVGYRHKVLACDWVSILGGLVWLAAYLIIAGYLYGEPLLYGGNIIPVAMSTGIAFLALGTGLIAASGTDSALLKPFIGPSIRARLLRTFIPLSAAFVVLGDLVYLSLRQILPFNEALLAPTISIVFSVVTAVVVWNAASTIGTTIDVAEARRREAEETLAESEERFRTLFEVMAQGVLIRDSGGTIIAANPAASHILDVGVDALVGSDGSSIPLELIDENDTAVEAITHTSVDVVPTGQPQHNIIRGFRADATQEYRWLLASVIPRFRPGEQQPHQLFTTFTDITDLRRMQRSLSREKDFTRALFDNLQEGVVACDSAGRINFTNAAFRKLHPGSRSGDEMGTWAESYHLFDADGSVQLVEDDVPLSRALRGEQVTDARLSVRTREGNVVQLSVNAGPILDRDRRTIGAVAVLRDITEELRAEAERRSSELQFRRILENVQDAYFRTDTAGRLVMLSPSAARIFGYESVDEMIGREASALYADPDVFSRILEDVQRSGSVEDRTGEGRMKDGSPFWLSLNARMYHAEDGTVAGTEGFIRDITERKRSEDALLGMQLLLQETGRIARIGGWQVEIPSMKSTWTQEVARIHEVEPGYDPNVNDGIQFYAPEARPIITEAVKRAIDTGEPYDLELPFITATGRRLWVNTSGRAVRENGRTVRIYGTFQDITERRQADEAFRLNALRLRQALHMGLMGSWEYDIVKGDLWMSKEAEKLMSGITAAFPDPGFSTADILRQMLDPAALDALLHHGTRLEQDYTVPTSHGEGMRMYHLHAERIADSEGMPVSIFGLVQDVTELRRAEIVIRENEERLRLALSAAELGMFDLDITSGNATVMPVTALNHRGEPATFTESFAAWIERMHPEDKQSVMRAFRDYIDGRTPQYKVEFRLPGADGAWEWFSSTGRIVTRDGHGAPVRMIGINQNISGRKRQEEEIRLQKERFEAIFEHIPVMLSMRNAERVPVRMNTEFVRTLGWTIDDARTIPDLFDRMYASAEDRRKATDFVFGDSPGWSRLLTTTKDGRQIYTSWARILLTDGTFIGIGQNIDEHVRYEDRINAFNEELEQRVLDRTRELAAVNKELEAFTYSVSHDLRAPLRAIDGFSRIFQEDFGKDLDREGVRILNVIRTNTQQMARLIDDLLAFSRLGRSPVQRVTTDMNAIVADVLFELDNNGQLRSGSIEVSALSRAYADPGMLRHVWANLISNAVKFTSHRNDPKITIREAVQDREIVYEISDNGAGFDMRYADKLFGVFQRLHTEAEFPGTGVGLAIVQRIVTRHGGRVWADGAVGAGATFSFTLPRVQEES